LSFHTLKIVISGMNLAIIHGTHAPLRKEKSGASEMISQLVFGEAIEILKQEDTWIFVRNLFDQYTGWMDIRLCSPLPDSYAPDELLIGKFVDAMLLPIFRNDIYGYKIQLLGRGAFFPDILCTEPYEAYYQFGKVTIEVQIDALMESTEFTGEKILTIASDFINVPYLWGGRTMQGIDCSGLVQTVYRISGVSLPRDAYQQAETGRPVDFSEAQPGDLAFFSNSDGKITHTGIFAGEGEIIHASGFVKSDELRKDGIYDFSLGRKTHNLHSMRSHFK
jgi:gamma-D-glutamyl-L-lysine dipeptidyl-peptidase